MTESGILFVVVLVSLAVAIRSMQRIMELRQLNRSLSVRVEKLEKVSIVNKDFDWLVKRVDNCDAAIVEVQSTSDLNREIINSLEDRFEQLSKNFKLVENLDAKLERSFSHINDELADLKITTEEIKLSLPDEVLSDEVQRQMDGMPPPDWPYIKQKKDPTE